MKHQKKLAGASYAESSREDMYEMAWKNRNVSYEQV